MQTRKPLIPENDDDTIFDGLQDSPIEQSEPSKINDEQKEIAKKIAKDSGFTSREEKKEKKKQYSEYTEIMSLKTKPGMKDIFDEISFYTKKKKQELLEEMVGLFLQEHKDSNLKSAIKKFEKL